MHRLAVALFTFLALSTALTAASAEAARVLLLDQEATAPAGAPSTLRNSCSLYQLR